MSLPRVDTGGTAALMEQVTGVKTLTKEKDRNSYKN